MIQSGRVCRQEGGTYRAGGGDEDVGSPRSNRTPKQWVLQLEDVQKEADDLLVETANTVTMAVTCKTQGPWNVLKE